MKRKRAETEKARLLLCELSYAERSCLTACMCTADATSGSA